MGLSLPINSAKNTDNNDNKRILWVDWLKTIGIIAILSIHVTALSMPYIGIFNINWYENLFIASLSRFGIIFFIIASGYLILRKEQEISDIPRRLKRVFLPFIFWLIVYALIKVVIQDELGSNWNILDLFLFIGKGFLDPTIISIQFWFIYMIMGLYILSPILSKWIHNAKISEIEFFLIIWIFVTFFRFFDINFLLVDYLRYFTGAIGYFILGYYLTIKKSKYLESRNFGWFLFILGTCICFLGSIIDTYITGKPSNLFFPVGDLTPNAFLQAIGLFIVIKNTDLNVIFGKFNSLVNNIVLKISVASYGIYLINVLIIKFMEKLNILSFTNTIALITIPILILIVLLISIIIVYIMDKIPFIKKFSGI